MDPSREKSPGDEQPNLRTRIAKAPPWTKFALIGIVGLIVGAALTWVPMKKALNESRSDNQQLESDLVAATADDRLLEERARKIDDGLAEAKEGIRKQIRSTLADARSVERQADAYTRRFRREDRALDARRRSLDRREERISGAEKSIKRNTITDGIWQVGVDFDPGTYRSDQSNCYWAELGSADNSDYITNGFGDNQTVTIDSPWFESKMCGTWTKIG